MYKSYIIMYELGLDTKDKIDDDRNFREVSKGKIKALGIKFAFVYLQAKKMYDEMYEKAVMHNEDGAWQMIFGVNTIPAYRKHGYAGQLLQCAIEDARKQGRKGLVLTCKDALIHYYAKFGFQNEGVTDKSVHGDAVWNQMRLTF